MREIIKLVVVLSLICGVSASALQVVRVNLMPVIEKQNDFYVRGPALEALFEKPAETLLGNKILFQNEGQTLPVFYCMENSEVTGLALEAIGKGGYGGDISLMVGIDLRSDEIIGIEIILHSETPGVGARIEKESFRKQWRKLSSEKHVFKNDGGSIDAISGATYSSSAVVNGSNVVIDLLKNKKTEILDFIDAQKQTSKSS